MTALWIIVCLAVLLALLCQLRVGTALSYGGDGLRVSVKAGPLRFQVFPLKKAAKKRAEKSAKKPKKARRPSEQMQKVSPVAMLKKALPIVAQAAGELRRKIRIDRIKLHVIWGGADPASAAMGFGSANALLGMLWPLLENNFTIKERDLRVDVDFERRVPTAALEAAATLKIGQGLALSWRLGIKLLKLYLTIQREQKAEKAVQA